jgi:hypothetical protein
MTEPKVVMVGKEGYVGHENQRNNKKEGRYTLCLNCYVCWDVVIQSYRDR